MHGKADLCDEDRKIIEEFEEMLRMAKAAKSKKERALILLEADRQARSGHNESPVVYED